MIKPNLEKYKQLSGRIFYIIPKGLVFRSPSQISGIIHYLKVQFEIRSIRGIRSSEPSARTAEPGLSRGCDTQPGKTEDLFF